jgi:hypothetical protein
MSFVGFGVVLATTAAGNILGAMETIKLPSVRKTLDSWVQKGEAQVKGTTAQWFRDNMGFAGKVIAKQIEDSATNLDPNRDTPVKLPPIDPPSSAAAPSIKNPATPTDGVRRLPPADSATPPAPTDGIRKLPPADSATPHAPSDGVRRLPPITKPDGTTGFIDRVQKREPSSIKSPADSHSAELADARAIPKRLEL